MATGLANSTDIKRESSKELLQEKIHLYFLQLTKGCGQKACENPFCATGSGNVLPHNQAAANAIMLVKKNAPVCMKSGTNGLVTVNKSDSQSLSNESKRKDVTIATTKDEPMELDPSREHESLKCQGMETNKLEESQLKFLHKENIALSEERLLQLLHEAENGQHKGLTSSLWNVFSSPQLLNNSFLMSETSLDEVPQVCHKTGILVDVPSVRRVYEQLFKSDVNAIINTLANVMDSYCTIVARDESLRNSAPLNHVVIIFENPLLHSPEFLERAYPQFLKMIMSLSINQKASLIEWYASYSLEDLSKLISSLRQLILVTTLNQDDSTIALQSNTAIASATHTLMLFYIANLLIAKRNNSLRPHSSDLHSSIAKSLPEVVAARKLNIFQILLSKFDVHPAEVLHLPIPFEEFTLEFVNSSVDMAIDYRRQKHKFLEDGSHMFSFLDHPFVLSTANKVETIRLDHNFKMFNERQRTLFHTVLTGIPDLPFLVLQIDRHDIVNDALAQLEAIAELNPADLRKQLRIKFKGEEGIDEGGLQKEFFQLLIERLFDPMNGMFKYDPDNHFYWFNLNSLESEQQYHLIGILLGLAIYNNIILDIHFPMVVYHKLIGCIPVFQDLYSSHPQIGQSLQSMLEFEGTNESFQETFLATFSVTYSDMFASVQTANLVENGEQIPVTLDNRKEYVDLYTDWLLNTSIAKQFDAFKNGFDLVMRDRSLADLFTAEEVELLVCGSKEWDFYSLEENTRYDGFTKTHYVIINFWEVFYEFSDKEKKQFLAFVTGSDRVPVGGLSKLQLIIVKNGPDSNRLPTAHTCFNALLLCEYNSKEKLKERLSTAIKNGKGFGML